ncbi:MAG: hypothetical protein ACFFG0_28890 [Candidatus Thorarchaeota archaeon]
MLIREAGILFHGTTVVFTNYHKAGNINLKLICKSKLIRELLSFSKCILPPIEYFEGTDYSIVTKKGFVKNKIGEKQEIFAFVVLDKDYNLERYLNSKVIPLLEELLTEFSYQYSGSELLKIDAFEDFKTTINRVLEPYQMLKV